MIAPSLMSVYKWIFQAISTNPYPPPVGQHWRQGPRLLASAIALCLRRELGYLVDRNHEFTSEFDFVCWLRASNYKRKIGDRSLHCGSTNNPKGHLRTCCNAASLTGSCVVRVHENNCFYFTNVFKCTQCYLLLFLISNSFSETFQSRKNTIFVWIKFQIFKHSNIQTWSSSLLLGSDMWIHELAMFKHHSSKVSRTKKTNWVDWKHFEKYQK